ncbi:phosphatidylinositide phosphatase SAC2-like [Cetorhinus maximus]
MELFKSQTEYTVRGADSCLSCSRSSGSMEIRAASDVDLSSAVCLGLVEGVVGKFQFHANLECFLILIQQKGLVGTVPGKHKMYKITKVAVIPLTDMEPSDLKLQFCKIHQRQASDSSDNIFQKKLPENPSPKRQENEPLAALALDLLPSLVTELVLSCGTKGGSFANPVFFLFLISWLSWSEQLWSKLEVLGLTGEEKLERRLLDELVKMFTDSDSFYYSLTYDITSSAQRQNGRAKGKERSPPWARVDDRFFWNKYMIRDLLKEKNAMAEQWIIPIIQGFVQMEEIHIHLSRYLEEESSLSDFSNLSLDEELLVSPEPKFLLVLISRRSRYRGGMRYKRRGIDSDGSVANYVETEQLIYSGDNILSFVQIRGSVPIYWSQQGYRYQPRPKLHKSDQENQLAFKAHFEEQFRIYNRVVIINLVDQTGPEKLIGDAYLRQVEFLNDPRIIYVAFDFHHQCHGRKFENVEVLTDGISNIINDLNWFRLTKNVVMSRQEGALRVNCMDCLDRANLVQAAVARKILEQQLRVLGLLPRQSALPQDIQRTFQKIWANNGDAISKQYAGTAALKSDLTQSGGSKLSAVMKDSYRAANRYYLNHFSHAYRQVVIDLMHGVQMTKDLHSLVEEEKPAKVLLKREHQSWQEEEIEMLNQACCLLLIPSTEEFLGGWLFTDCRTRLVGSSAQDVDVMFLLSNHACYFA